MTDWIKKGNTKLLKGCLNARRPPIGGLLALRVKFTKRALHIVKKGMDFIIPFLFSINKG